MRKVIGLIMRILTLPFIFCMCCLWGVFQVLRICCNYIYRGGEFIAYTKANDTKTIADVFDKLTNKL